jgi:hypothetical protein
MKLNGWQRLWIVCTITWIVAVGAFYAFSRGSENKLYHEWANELILYLIEQSSDLQGHTVISVRSAYSDLSDRQLIDALHDKYLPKHPAYTYGFAEIDAKYKLSEKVATGEHRFQGDVVWLMIAFGIPASMYLVGGAIAWVRAGFRAA